MKQKQGDNHILWTNLAIMVFSGVWGFGNIINGFSEYNGLKAIVAWLMMFAVYFIPYTLMVGELGSAFKNEGGGVSSWINATIGPRVAYLAAWTYWVVHMPYIANKAGTGLIAASWMIFRDNRISQMNTTVMQLIRLVVFLLALYLANRGIRILRKLATLAGSAMFAMSLLFILLMITAPALTDASLVPIEWTPETFTPKFDAAFFLNVSILVYAVGGCEKYSPYVNKMKNPSKDFAKGMMVMAGMVVLCAVLGTIALGMMFDSNNIPKDLMTNGAYYAFQTLGHHYHVGDLFLILYAAANLITQVSGIIISVDARRPPAHPAGELRRQLYPQHPVQEEPIRRLYQRPEAGGCDRVRHHHRPRPGHQECGRAGEVDHQAQLHLYAPAVSVGLCGIHCPEESG